MVKGVRSKGMSTVPGAIWAGSNVFLTGITRSVHYNNLTTFSIARRLKALDFSASLLSETQDAHYSQMPSTSVIYYPSPL